MVAIVLTSRTTSPISLIIVALESRHLAPFVDAWMFGWLDELHTGKQVAKVLINGASVGQGVLDFHKTAPTLLSGLANKHLTCSR